MAKPTKLPTKKELEEVLGRKEDFYVSVNNINTVRLSLLESRKYTLQSMRLFEELKTVRNAKIDEKNSLRKNLKKISITINKIKQAIPQVKLPPEPKPSKEDKKSNKEEPKQKQVFIVPEPEVAPPPAPKPEPKKEPAPVSELDRIEQELADIEGKLSDLA